MLCYQFNQLVNQIPALADAKIHQLELLLTIRDALSKIICNIEKRLVESPCCPHCHHEKIIRHGKQKGMHDIVVNLVLKPLFRQPKHL